MRRLISVHCLLTRISISNGTKHEKIHLTPLKRQVDSTNVYGWESPLGLLGLIVVGPSLWIYFHTFRGSWTEISLKTLVFPSITYLSHRPSWSGCWITVNVLKVSNTLFHTFFYLNTAFMQLYLKILSGMANRVDPDQSAPEGAVWSRSTLFAYAILFWNFKTFTETHP